VRGKRKSDGAANTGRGDTVGLGWTSPFFRPCPACCCVHLSMCVMAGRNGSGRQPSVAHMHPHRSRWLTFVATCLFPTFHPLPAGFFLPPSTHLVVHSLCKVLRLFPAISSAIQMISHLTGSPPFSCILAPPLSLHVIVAAIGFG